MKLKKGDKVVMNDMYCVPEENNGEVWTVASEPWKVCGVDVVMLEGFSGCYAVDGLDKVSSGCNGDYCDIE